MEKDVCPNCGQENCNSLFNCKKCKIVCCVHCNPPCGCNAGFEPVEAIDKNYDLHSPEDEK